MTAVRLARGATGRAAVVKFEGCYHGHSDALLAAAGSGVATLGLPGSAGVTPGAVADTIVLPYNDGPAVREAFDRRGDEIACVIVEPIAANMGVVPPAAGFLDGLRAACDASGALLVFDEVITGFRVGSGGAQALFGIRPDLTILGKVMGGGFPCAAVGGRRDLMEQLAPDGPGLPGRDALREPGRGGGGAGGARADRLGGSVPDDPVESRSPGGGPSRGVRRGRGPVGGERGRRAAVGVLHRPTR